LNLDQANDYADFKIFKAVYDENNGAGSFAAMTAGVPEPSTVVLIGCCGLFAVAIVRRSKRD
jgi:hypothetical protein